MKITRRNLGFDLIAALAALPDRGRTERIVLHVPIDVVKLCRIAQHSRNNPTLESWILETLEDAVSSYRVFPKEKP